MFTPEQIEKWKAEGHWPPPPGVIVKEEKIIVSETDNNFAELLSFCLPPRLRKVLLKK